MQIGFTKRAATGAPARSMLAAAGLLLFLAAGGLAAGTGNLATTFGLLPEELGSAQSQALFGQGSSAAFYNPAALGQNRESQLAAAYLRADPGLKVLSKGGPSAPVRFGSTVDTPDNELALVGLKLGLENAFGIERSVSLGLVVGLDDRARNVLVIEDRVSTNGQFLQYGRKPLLLAGGLGVEVYDGIHIGAGSVITVGATAGLKLNTTLGGRTASEDLDVRGETRTANYGGVLLEPGSLFCRAPKWTPAPEDPPRLRNRDDLRANCWLDRFSLAFAYHDESYFDIELDARAAVQLQQNQLANVPLALASVDGYTPVRTSWALKFRAPGRLIFYYSYEQHRWGDLTPLLRSRATARDQGLPEFTDVQLRRYGVEYRGLGDHLRIRALRSLALRAGYAFEKSPLVSQVTPGANLFDADRRILAAGLEYTLYGFLATPITISFGLQRHLLTGRTFAVTNTGDGSGTPGLSPPEFRELVETSGSVTTWNAAVTMRF